MKGLEFGVRSVLRPQTPSPRPSFSSPTKQSPAFGLHLAPRGEPPVTSLLMVESRCIMRCRWLSRLAPDEHLARAAACDSRSLCRTIASQPSHSDMVCA